MTKRKFTFPLIAGLFLTLSALPQMVLAEATPSPGNKDQRVRYITHTPGQVYTINTRRNHITLVELDPGEGILTVTAGDNHSFTVEEIGNQQSFIIKPTVSGASTNVVVETNRNYYFLDVRENSRATPYYTVRIGSPDGGRRSRTTSASSIPASPPLAYAMTDGASDHPFAPVRVWDDGRLTHFSFAPDAPIPAIFRADSEGDEHSVNTRANGTTITATSRSNRWVLRYGDDFICIDGKAAQNG